MQEHDKWLLIAKEDLMVAKVLLSREFFSSAVYHCQQSAEKSLKGYLAFKKQEIIKTHDLAKLLGLCLNFDEDFKKLYEAARYLNPFSIAFRYPTEFDIPDQGDARLAVKYAQSIITFVLKKVAAPGTGQADIFGDYEE